jgi:hypothetical protein
MARETIEAVAKHVGAFAAPRIFDAGVAAGWSDAIATAHFSNSRHTLVDAAAEPVCGARALRGMGARGALCLRRRRSRVPARGGVFARRRCLADRSDRAAGRAPSRRSQDHA